MPRVCVFECRTGGLKLHVFPIHDATRFRTWVEIVSRNMGTPADCDYYRRKRICDKHFADKHKVANNRVSNNAVPTLYLDGKSSEIERREFSPPQQPTTQTDQIPCQSETTLSAAVLEMDHDYCRPMVILSSKENLSTNYQSSTVSAAVIEMDHDYSEPMVIHSSKKKISTKYSVNVMKPSVVSHLPTIKRQVKNLKREVSRLRKKGSSFKTRLQNAEKLNNNMALKRVTKNMTSASKLFTELQFRETTKKVKGRRFKMEEKVLALSLYKRSPRMYPLLSKFLHCPQPKL